MCGPDPGLQQLRPQGRVGLQQRRLRRPGRTLQLAVYEKSWASNWHPVGLEICLEARWILHKYGCELRTSLELYS